jgi:hypothetical protein
MWSFGVIQEIIGKFCDSLHLMAAIPRDDKCQLMWLPVLWLCAKISQ